MLASRLTILPAQQRREDRGDETFCSRLLATRALDFPREPSLLTASRRRRATFYGEETCMTTKFKLA